MRILRLIKDYFAILFFATVMGAIIGGGFAFVCLHTVTGQAHTNFVWGIAAFLFVGTWGGLFWVFMSNRLDQEFDKKHPGALP